VFCLGSGSIGFTNSSSFFVFFSLRGQCSGESMGEIAEYEADYGDAAVLSNNLTECVLFDGLCY